ncbi:MAG: hypothetical protein IJ634_00605 [Bacteroidales bacterium]|nr:hypothetical protein [Bacteroidales bacterium]
MNNTFDWNRFCKVVNKDFRNLWPMFGTTMIVLASLPFAIWLLFTVIGGSGMTVAPEVRVGMLMFFASLAGIMLPSRLYRTMNLRNEGIYFAMLPASKLEKFLSIMLFSFIVAPVCVYLGSLVLDIILRLMPAGPYHDWIWNSTLGFPLLTVVPMDEDFLPGFHSWILTAVTWTSMFNSTALFLFAATLFKKHKVLYTFLILYAIEFVLTIIAIPIFVALAQSPDFMEWLYDTFRDRFSSPEKMMNTIMAVTMVFNIIVTVLFTWLSWRRLKKMPY